MKLKHLDLFSGIGGFALAARYCKNIETVAFCEQDNFCKKVLRKNFPNVPIFDDVKKLIKIDSDSICRNGYYECSLCNNKNLTESCECFSKKDFIDFFGNINIITAGFPCQDISNAKTEQINGLQGLSGQKSSLFYESIRIIERLQPNVVIFENVPSIRNRGADEICNIMEKLGYYTWLFILATKDFGGQIQRQRAWFISIQKSKCERLQGQIFKKMAEQKKRGQNANIAGPDWGRTTPRIRGATNGIPNWMDRLKSLGNSLTPQIPYTIMNTIKILYE